MILRFIIPASNLHFEYEDTDIPTWNIRGVDGRSVSPFKMEAHELISVGRLLEIIRRWKQEGATAPSENVLSSSIPNWRFGI